jgi:hypothetical protein
LAFRRLEIPAGEFRLVSADVDKTPNHAHCQKCGRFKVWHLGTEQADCFDQARPGAADRAVRLVCLLWMIACQQSSSAGISWQTFAREATINSRRPERFAATVLGETQSVKTILKTQRRMANSKDLSAKPALQQSVDLNRKRIVAALLELGADVNGRDKRGATALHAAAFWGHVEIARLLISHHADVNATDRAGFTPLHESARLYTLAVARLLLKVGARIHAKDRDGRTPLDVARQFEDRSSGWAKRETVNEMIELLLGHTQ